jgi:membrane protease YdiL (CAAX protease family)
MDVMSCSNAKRWASARGSFLFARNPPAVITIAFQIELVGEITTNGTLFGMDNQEILFPDASRPIDLHSHAARRDAVLRSAVFWVGFFVCLFLMRILIGFLGLGQPTAGDTRGQWYGGIIMTFLTLALKQICVRMDRGPVVEPGTRIVRGSIPRAFFGLLCVIPLCALSIVSLQWLVPGVRFERTGISILSVVSAIGLYLVLAAYEEIGFRGYPMRQLLRSFGVWPTLLLIAPVFALYHLT